MIFLIILLRGILTYQTEVAPDFKSQTIDSAISIGYGLALGDVDGDKKPDILLADKKQIVWYRNGDWKKFIMAENLTEQDNVCIAARDLDGDGRVEVAVGAQWNPSETKDSSKSGSVHFLIRPADPTKAWRPIRLYHEVTIHRMRWLRSENENYLLVLPLHGKNNEQGNGVPVNLLVFHYPSLLQESKPRYIISTNMHITHNLDIGSSAPGKELVYIGGKQGIGVMDPVLNATTAIKSLPMQNTIGVGELRVSNNTKYPLTAAIEPLHGSHVVGYTEGGQKRTLLDSSYSEGHALAVADVLGMGHDQVIAGWRRPNANGKVGIKLFSRIGDSLAAWKQYWIDDNEMACEDLQVLDLNNDGKPEIVAAGRATHNLKIYWNNSGK